MTGIRLLCAATPQTLLRQVRSGRLQMLRQISFACATLAALTVCAVPASAQDRFALVIGNANYKSVTALSNPARDAEAVGTLLKDAGFQVTAALDLDKSNMSKVIRFFTSSIAEKPENTVALIYFAGHGVQVDGENFLVPVDATIAREADVPLEAMRMGDLMSMLETVRAKTRIVILDACRDNPFDDISKTAPRGLAMVNAPAGTLLAYSTSPGHTADDGSAGNSPFAQALLKSARQPGLPIETALKNVRLAVHGATGGRQTPWEVSALTEPFAFFPGSAPLASDPNAGKSEAAWREELKAVTPRQAFDLTIREDNVTVYEIYLSIYGNDALAPSVRSLFDRRQLMTAWLEVVTLNTASAFEAFLSKFPDSDLAETARRLKVRAEARSSFARSISPVLGLSANAQNDAPPVRTVVREVRVPSPPEIRTVVKEVRVPSPPEIRTVVREVVREVKVPVVREVVKTVHVPGPSKPCNCGRPRPTPGPDIDRGGGRHPRFDGGRNPRFEGGRNPRRQGGGGDDGGRIRIR
jgi:hypothetical protein